LRRGTVRKEEPCSPAFGMWKDRADMVDVHAYLRRLRGRVDAWGLSRDRRQATETD